MANLSIDDVLGPWKGHKDVTAGVMYDLQKLVESSNNFIKQLELAGVVFRINPLTKSIVSGQTLGGFRPKDAKVGAGMSLHKRGLAVDIYDPKGEIDKFCLDNPKVLKECGIWIEHPSQTNLWSHWQILPPKSGNRYFYP